MAEPPPRADGDRIDREIEVALALGAEMVKGSDVDPAMTDVAAAVERGLAREAEVIGAIREAQHKATVSYSRRRW